MTILVWLAVGGGIIFLISAIENVPLLDTIKSVIQNKQLPKADPNTITFPDALKHLAGDVGNAFWQQTPFGHSSNGSNSGPNLPYIPSIGLTYMSGPGTFVTPTAVTFTEPATIQGFIGTCVETAGAILQQLSRGVQVTKQGIQNAAYTLYNRFNSQGEREADIRGATNFAAESQLLAGQGFSTQVVHVADYSANQLASTITQYVQGGIPVGIGWGNATVLKDTLSGTRYDLGVLGHAGVVEGVDQTGAFIADPNTPQGTPLVHYTWQNLADAHTNDLLVPDSSGVLQ